MTAFFYKTLPNWHININHSIGIESVFYSGWVGYTTQNCVKNRKQKLNRYRPYTALRSTYKFDYKSSIVAEDQSVITKYAYDDARLMLNSLFFLKALHIKFEC